MPTITRPQRGALEAIARHAPDTARATLGNTLTLAKADPDLVIGVEVLKVGTFNGVVTLDDADLDALAARFHELTGVFTPPMRLDHSWDVLSVVGWFEDLRVEERVDPTDAATPKPYLVGDFRLVGTAAERAQLREWITSGKLRNRSSELMPYVTNTGREFSQVFAGCAFVDIPAVEGLSPIALRREALTKETDQEEATVPTDDTSTEGTEAAPAEAVTTDATTDPAEGTEGQEGQQEAADTGAGAEGTPANAPTAEDGHVILGDPEPEDEDEEQEGQQEVPDEAQLRGAMPTMDALRGMGLTEAQATALRAHVDAEVQLRTEATERLTRYRAAGVIPLAAATQVEHLLRHTDRTVRDATAQLLDLARPPVNLDARLGEQASTTVREDGRVTPDELRKLSGDEFGEAWASLTSAERKTPEYRAAYHEATGTRSTTGV